MSMQTLENIVLENDQFCLKINCNCQAESLIHKGTDTECLMHGEETALFSLVEERPYNNEIKLMHPNKRTVFQANRVKQEENKLIVGFELLPWEAVVEYKIAPKYISFQLSDYRIKQEDFSRGPSSTSLDMDLPPVYEFRLLQLPVKSRKNFGEWLNVVWDETVAVNVLATSPFTRIDGEKRKNHVILTADVMRDIRLKNCGAALIVSDAEELLDAIASVEEDYNLPRGVESRRSGKLNTSVYWTANANPENIEEHIAYAKQAGFRMMLFYLSSIYKDEGLWEYNGDFAFWETYPNGLEDVREMLRKVKEAGITPGIHFLHTHIGSKSHYVTPVADHRLHLNRYFTLARSLGIEDDTIYVEQNPEGAAMHPKRRVLEFGGELISYEGYSTEWPYCFTGCVRGHWDTLVKEHEIGTIGGILDISEFGGTSTYLDQESSLQDEIAEKLAETYNAGFEFAYFDGSEGTNAPFEIYVPYAQYRVYRKFEKTPIFCEGAAKAHFSWHMLSGGNAFDVFPSAIFKDGIAKYPAAEAPSMAKDFTRVDFGWWCYYQDTQPDIFEYGTSRAAAWDCPVTMQENQEVFQSNPRTGDNFEVLRRWEDVRQKGWLTAEQKLQLQDLGQEHILLINENQKYELVPYDRIETAASGSTDVTAYAFERNGKVYVVCWHTTGSGKLWLPIAADQICYEEEIGGERIDVMPVENGCVIPLEGRRYVSCCLSKKILIDGFKRAKIIK